MRPGLVVLLPLSLALGCSSDIGECQNLEAAQQLVYGPGGIVATKGQALMHESCGQGAFCHSDAAAYSKREGAPHGMDFDMLPRPSGLAKALDLREGIWGQVDQGSMPPRSYAVGDALWTYSRARRAGERHLPKLQTSEGKAILRNWLACGAPVVTESRVPDWAQIPGDLDPLWSEIHPKLIVDRCATSGCHDKGGAAGDLVLEDMCAAREALLEVGDCNERRVVPGDTSSFLIEKVSSDAPSCGARMPTIGALEDYEIEALRTWVADGAQADACP